MPNSSISILLIEDNPGDVFLLKEILSEAGDIAFTLVCKETLKEGLQILKEKDFDVILLDLSLPDGKGLSSLSKIKEQDASKPIIILTGNNDSELAKKSIYEGAQDYLVKGQIDHNLLTRAITYAIERKEMEQKVIESEIQYRDLIELSPDAIAIHSDGKIVYVNSAAIRLANAKDKSEILGKSVMDFVYSEMKPQIAERIIKMKRGEKVELAEEKLLKVDGSFIDVEVVAAPIIYKSVKSIQVIIRDITEKKKLEDSIKRSEEKYRGLYHNASIGIFHTTPEGNFLDVNPALAKMFGYSSSGEMINEVRDLNSGIYLDPERRALIISKIIDADDWLFFENAYWRKDGSILTGNLAGRKELNKDGSIAYIEGFIQDITDRKIAEESLKKQSLLNAKIAELAGAILSANSLDEITSITLAKARELTGSSNGYVGFIDPKSNFLVVPNLTLDIWDQYRVSGENMIFEKFTGLCGWVLVNKKSLMTNNPEKDFGSSEIPQGSVTVKRFLSVPAMHGSMLAGQITLANPENDFTESDLINIEQLASVYALGISRMQAVNEVLESQERFKLAFQHSNVGTIIIGIDKKFLKVNSTFTNMLGYTDEEMLGKTFEEITYYDDRETGNSEFMKMLNGEADFTSFEKRYLHKNGNIIWALVSSAILRDAQNNPMYFVTHLQDFTKRKEAEETIKGSLKEKEVLIRELYHRTKNNMQVISSMLGLKAMTIRDKHTISILNEMENRIQTMALVHQKLYQSQNLSRVDLREYITDLAKLLIKSYYESKDKVALKLDLDSISVLIDTAIPCGLLINELVSNSFKYAFPGDRKGEISISLKKLDSDLMELIVSDDGIGITGGFDSINEDSLGVKILLTIAENQLQGAVKCSTENGVVFSVVFNDSLYSERV